MKVSYLKNIFLIGLIALLSFLNFVWAENPILTNEEAVINAFNNSGAKFTEMNMNFKGKISDEYFHLEKLVDLGQKITKELGLAIDIKDLKNYNNKNDNFKVIELNASRQITIYGKSQDENIVTIILSTSIDTYTGAGETDLFIDLVGNNSYKDLEEDILRIKNIFSDYKIKAEITSCIIGTFEGKLESSNKVKKITKTLQVINGNKIEGIMDESIISISAYSPNIDRFIYTGNNKMNLNIAMRYNEYEGKTYYWIGSPIITIEY